MLLLGIILTPLLVGVFILIGLTLVNPNKSKIVLLFGEYKGTIRKPGFYWVNPLSVRRDISLRVNNFNSEKLKVNDLRGNPIEIGTVVVWRVNNTAQAAFDVQDYESYVEVQTESALRTTPPSPRVGPFLWTRFPRRFSSGTPSGIRWSAT